MTKLYKLTDQNNYTRRGQEGETLWEEGKEYEITIPGNTLCTPQVYHAYTHYLIADIFNSGHANYNPYHLWEISGDIVIDDGTKVGCKKIKAIKLLENPIITRENKIGYAILITRHVYKKEEWNKWADNWLSNTDRSAKVAAYAANAAYYAANAAHCAANAADYAASAAHCAAYAAYYAAYTTSAACAANAADYAASAAHCAAYAAYYAAYTASAYYDTDAVPSTAEFAEKAMLIK